MPEPDWSFPFEGTLHETFPALHEAQSAWLAQIAHRKDPQAAYRLLDKCLAITARLPQDFDSWSNFGCEAPLAASNIITLPSVRAAANALPCV